jgi:NSS family neurotransmitter:Na+ symporter
VIFWQFLFMLATVAIVLGGIRGGIERWSKVLMPVLFLLLVLLFIRGMLSPGARAGLEFMFRPDFASLTPGALLDALGHAFFTLSLGAGTMITYGSYLERESDLFALSLRIAALDTLVALLAGVAIFSVVFAAGLEAAAGPGLVFQTIPIVFSTLPFGSLLATLFFILLAFAALSSSISMLEVPVAYLIDEKGWPRLRATILVGSGALLLGIPAALSFNLWGEVKPLFGRTFFDLYDTLVSSYMMPLGGLCVSLYAGWFWRGEGEANELAGPAGRPWLFPVWRFLVRFVAPAAVLVIFLNQAGIFW